MTPTEPSILKQAREQGLATPRAGMAVPDGYFENFAAGMMSRLPYREEAENPDIVEYKSPWQKLRPYVYMAAMFCGIWLMLQMFGMLRGGAKLSPMEENPVIAEAFGNDDFMYNYYFDDLSCYDIYEHYTDEDFHTIYEEEALDDDELLQDSEQQL